MDWAIHYVRRVARVLALDQRELTILMSDAGGGVLEAGFSIAGVFVTIGLLGAWRSGNWSLVQQEAVEAPIAWVLSAALLDKGVALAQSARAHGDFRNPVSTTTSSHLTSFLKLAGFAHLSYLLIIPGVYWPIAWSPCAAAAMMWMTLIYFVALQRVLAIGRLQSALIATLTPIGVLAIRRAVGMVEAVLVGVGW